MEATIDLNRVGVFLRVVESGSFTRAAELLGLPKSSVSRSVAQLEEALGVRLLQRTTRTLSLTDAGRLYFAEAKVALGQLEEAHALVARLRAEPSGTVRVTALPDLALVALPPIIADFVREHPKVKIELSLSSRRVDLVEEGYDIALRGGALGDSSLVARKIAATEVALYASKSYLREHGRPRSLAELESHDCVLFRAQGHRAAWRLSGPRGEERVDVQGHLVVDDLAFASRAVACGVGIGLVPSFLALQNPELERVLPEYAMHGTELHVVMPSARHASLAVLRFRDFLAQRLQGFPWSDPASACPPAPAKRSRSRQRR